MFFPPVSFSFFLWHGSLWCNWKESSVQDSQWETALAIIGGQTLLSASCDPCSQPRCDDLYHVSCCAESTCGSAETQTKQEEHYDHIQQKNFSHSFPLIKSCSSFIARTQMGSNFIVKCYNRPGVSFDYLGIWSLFHTQRYNTTDRQHSSLQ